MFFDLDYLNNKNFSFKAVNSGLGLINYGENQSSVIVDNSLRSTGLYNDFLDIKNNKYIEPGKDSRLFSYLKIFLSLFVFDIIIAFSIYIGIMFITKNIVFDNNIYEMIYIHKNDILITYAIYLIISVFVLKSTLSLSTLNLLTSRKGDHE